MASVAAVEKHLAALRACERCPRMHRPAVVGRGGASRVLLVGQAPGDKEPKLGRPFAWTAGKTLFKWFHAALGWSEDEVRDRIYFAAVCRCFPGKRPEGGDRVPAPDEIAECGAWLELEFALLRPDAGAAGGQARDLAVPRRAAADRDHREKISDHVSRLRGGVHPAAASLGRLAVASDGAGEDAARRRARLDRAASGDG